MRVNAHHVTTVTKSSRTAHVEFTSSSRHVHELVRVAMLPCLLTHTVTCTSRNRVGAAHQALYVGTTTKFSLEQCHDVTLFQRHMPAGGGGIYTFLGHCSPFHYMQHMHVSDFFFFCIRFIWLPEHDSKAYVGINIF